MTVALVLLSRVSFRGQEITGPRLRGLLALLAGDLRAGCGTARLVGGLWPDEQPENPAKALQVIVSRARAQLGADVIVSTPTGYRLALGEEQVDASAVVLSASASLGCSRAGDHAGALAHAEAGLAWWEGAAGVGGGAGDPLSALRAARASTWRTLVRARALSLSRLGRRAEAVEPLNELVREHPRDEELLVELLRCEAATVGPATALARYDAYRRGLRDDLGGDPGPALQGVYRELLTHGTPAVRRGVAYEPNPLLGRDDDIVAVTGLLRTSRVTSIVGAGGLGKTRLAHAVSRGAEQRVVHVVALAGLTSDADVVSEVASVLGVDETGRTPAGRPAGPVDVLTGIVTALEPGPALLVLDNCEHLVRGVADLVHALVSMSRELRVLTTSRAPLGLSSESVYLLPELSLATTVELFRQRATAARPGVELPASAVQEVCAHLDGLPLAVELAAARVRVMAVDEIAKRLDDRFALLRGGARDAPQRHRTLHAVIDWSWNLLSPAGRAAMRAWSVFPGGFTADSARQMLDGGDVVPVLEQGDVVQGDVVPVLEQLVDQSLLKVTDTASGTRFRMVETVREFATARRDEAGETDGAIGSFLVWARGFALAHHGSIFGPDLISSARRIRAEQDNLVQALRHALDRRDGATVAATTAALGGLWTVESNLVRMATLAAQTAWTLSHFRPEPALVEATGTACVLCVVSSFIVRGGRPLRFLAALRRLPSARPDTLAGATQVVLGAVIEMPESGLAGLHALCDSDEAMLAGMANGAASYAWEGNGDLDSALKAARRMLTAFAGQDMPWIQAVAHSRIGELCLQAGQGVEARRHLTATLSLLEALHELELSGSVARVRWAIVLANLQCGAVDEAERRLEPAVRAGGVEEAGVVMLDLGVRAEIRLARGDVDAGLRLWRSAVGRLPAAERSSVGSDLLGAQAWVLEATAVAVVAHAQHGRLDLVEEIAGGLPHTLASTLTNPVGGPAASFVDLPICGALLLALAMVDLDRGERTGDARATRSAARMIALAERFRYVRGFQPTMSVANARRFAERADRSAYADAVSSYADLGPAAARSVAAAALQARDQFTGPDHG